jgi:hypothetical protein
MAKADQAGQAGDPTVGEDSSWSPSKLTVTGIVTLAIAITIIVFMATRMTTCMYLDGSH